MHTLTPVFILGERLWWCSLCGAFGCVSTAGPVSTLPRLCKVDGEFVIELRPGCWVAWRGREFYHRRRGTVGPQYIRDRAMYSVNSASTLLLGQAKRWRSRQAAHKANSKLCGRVVRLEGSHVSESV